MTDNPLRHPVQYRGAVLVEATLRLLESATTDITRNELTTHLENQYHHNPNTLRGLLNDLANLGAIRITTTPAITTIRITELGEAWLNATTPTAPRPHAGQWHHPTDDRWDPNEVQDLLDSHDPTP